MNDSAKYERSKVVQIVHSVISKMEGLSGESLNTLRQELLDLEAAIDRTRTDIAPGTVDSSQARDELDAVVVATKEATDIIMNAGETLEAFAQSQPADVQAMITQQVTRIYEACSFQDITGQRIGKVITLLHEVQGKVGDMLKVITSEVVNAPEEKSDDELMNGPQLPSHALSQEDIDKLLAGFD